MKLHCSIGTKKTVVRFIVRSVMKCIVCSQSVWAGTLAVDTKQGGLCWQQCSMFLCHRQLCTAGLVCAREEERTCQRITEEPIHIPL